MSDCEPDGVAHEARVLATTCLEVMISIVFSCGVAFCVWSIGCRRGIVYSYVLRLATGDWPNWPRVKHDGGFVCQVVSHCQVDIHLVWLGDACVAHSVSRRAFNTGVPAAVPSTTWRASLPRQKGSLAGGWEQGAARSPVKYGREQGQSRSPHPH